MSIYSTCLVVVVLCGLASPYKLNVPHLLLPYHPTIPIKFELEVGSPSGGCFSWRSNRPDVVQVTPIGNEDCSDRAQVVSTAKFSGPHSAVIFAEDRNGGTTLSCGVTVDDVASLAVEHTTKILYVDDAPAPITAVAFNSDGDKFSTLGEIPFEWELSSDNAEQRPLRIVPFEQSKYRAPADIQSLESAKKKGYLVLLEGLVTGSSMISTRFHDDYFSKVAPHSLDVVVIANLILDPAQDLYVPIHSEIHFVVKIVKESGVDNVAMPSPSYTLRLDDSSVCALNTKTSVVTAIKKGSSNLILYTENVDSKVTKNAAVRPPSTKIHVVDPETLQFTVSGDNWLLERSRQYRVNVNLLDTHGNHMFIADNTRCETVFPLDFFDIITSSRNGTYFIVVPKKAGRTTLKSRFRAFVTESGIEIVLDGKIAGEQEVEIADPIEVKPSLVTFPYLARSKFEYKLKAIGGSGTFAWSSSDTSVVGVEESTGSLRSAELGWATVTARDRRNRLHSASAKVGVVEVAALSFGKTRKEAEEGQLLKLNVQLYGRNVDGEHIPLTDCRAVPLKIEIHGGEYFEHVTDAAAELPREGTGCTTVTLKALRSGDTKVTVRFEQYHSTIDISSYAPLKVSAAELLLPVGSTFKVNLQGGPRPWVLDGSQFYVKGKSDENGIVSTSWTDALALACSSKEGPTTVDVHVGNGASATLELPAEAKARVRVCCARPSRLALSVQTPSLPRHLPTCPSSPATPVFAGSPFAVNVRAYARCGSGSEERVMHGAAQIAWKWSVDNGKLLRLEDAKNSALNQEDDTAQKQALPSGDPGKVRITATVTKCGSATLPSALTSSLDISLVQRAVAEPDSLVLWNDPTAAAVVVLRGGSGHFHVTERSDYFGTKLAGSQLTVTPKRLGKSSLRLVDVCIDSTPIEIPIKITDIHSLRIKAPSSLEVGKSCDVDVEVVDESGDAFSAHHVSVMNVELTASNEQNVRLDKKDAMRFTLRGTSVGVLTLSASARSSAKGAIRSRPHTLQIFAPIQLLPKQVTLIPESTFQLEVIGGPRPLPPISFTLNDSRVVNVEPNALITSRRNLGYVRLTGTIEEGDGRSSRDSVIVKVVSLGGVRVVLSTKRTEVGAKIWARVDGLSSDEVPFAFGGALYPFKVTWSVSDGSVLSLESPLGDAIAEPDANRFAVWLAAKSAGRTSISVTVELHKNAHLHFQGSSKTFTAQTDIVVDESTGLAQPSLRLSSVRVAPDSQMRLKSTWPESETSWEVPPAFASHVAVTRSGQLRSLGSVGSAAILMKRNSAGINATILVPVQVTPAVSIDVWVDPALASSNTAAPLSALPVGLAFSLRIRFRDRHGLLLDAAQNSVNYRPHRFDLTDIVASDENRTLTITMKSPGETVLKLWDPEDETLSTFVRLSALDQLTPTTLRPIVVSDVMCFNSPLETDSEWSTSDDRLHLIGDAVAFARRAGETQVKALTAQGHTLHATITIEHPGFIGFDVDHPTFVSNMDETRFVFPVRIARHSNETFEGSVIGCRSDRELPVIQAPFLCNVQFVSSQPVPASHLFVARAVFDVTKHFYACVVEKQIGGLVPSTVTDYKKTDVVLTTQWTGDHLHQLSSEVRVPFHMAFELADSQVAVWDGSESVLGIRAPAYLLSSISATITECPHKLKISETSKSHGTSNKQFLIQLIGGYTSANGACTVKVENAVTGQRVLVPISVRASSRKTTAVENAGFFSLLAALLDRFSAFFVPMMTLCIAAIVLLAAWLFARAQRSKSGVAALHTSGVFASDAPMNISQQSSPSQSPGASYVWKNSPPRYHSTPLETSSVAAAAASPIGARGSPQLWAATDIRRRF